MSVLAVDPAQRIGALSPWDLIINLPPGIAFFVMLLISPVAIKYGIRPFIEGRILRRSDEFLSFLMDVMFAPTLACGLVLVRHMDDRVYFGVGWFDIVAVLLAFGLGAVHFYQERHAYSWRALFTPSKMYHELLFTFVGYLLIKVCAVGLIFAPWTYELVVMRVVMLTAISLWACSWPLYDEQHKFDVIDDEGHNYYWYAHVENAWPWQHRYRQLSYWWRRYLADWRKTPGRIVALYRRVTA